MKRLLVEGFGKGIAFRNGVIEVREKGRLVARASPAELEQVIVSGRCYITTGAIMALAESGCDVVFLGSSGRFYARLSFPELRTVATRREQYMAYEDGRGLEVAKEVLRSKLRNERYYLETLRKGSREGLAEFEACRRAEEVVASALESVEGVSGSLESARPELLGIEGMAAEAYWGALSAFVPKELGFAGRIGRGAADPFNSMLNYGYGVLLGIVWRGIHVAGLDPYAGFLHADRPGKPSLVLDLMEMFRTQLVDRAVLALARKGLSWDRWTREVAEAVLSRASERVTYMGRSVELAEAPLIVARGLAAFLRGERRGFDGFWLRW